MDALAVVTIVGTGIGLVAGCVQIADYLERKRQASRLTGVRPAQQQTILHQDAPAPVEKEPRCTGNLPASHTSFVGRETQTAEVKFLLETSRLLTLSGAGGAGKTRFALHVTAQVQAQFPDGAWLAELAPLSDPALVPQTVAAVLDVREETGVPLTQTLAKAIGNKHLLLLLDNCEHLLPAACALAQTLLHTCPRLRVLATSRAPLGLPGEQNYRVPPLSVPGKDHVTADSLADCDAVRLFTERAKLADVRFAVTNANAPAVASICRHLDGIPLAIELAAARVRSLPPEHIAARLHDRFSLLTGGTGGPRQGALRATVDWSYNLLSDDEKQLLRALSVCAGGWTLDAAEAIGTVHESPSMSEGGPPAPITGSSKGNTRWNGTFPPSIIGGPGDPFGGAGGDVLNCLSGLVDKSLVAFDASRYGLLETVWQYAGQERDLAGETDTVRARHAAFFLALAEEAAEGMVGPEQGTWLARLEDEHDNCRAALVFCLSYPEGACDGLRLAGALTRFWWMHGSLSEGRQWLQKVLAHDTDALPTAARALALHSLGNIDCFQGHHDAAQGSYEQALAIREETRDRRGMAGTLGALGNLAQYRGDYGAARALFEQSLAMNREMGNRVWEAANLTCLASLTYDLGDYAAAQEWGTAAVALNRELGNHAAEANTLVFVGKTAQALGDFAQAEAHLDRSVALSTALGDHTEAALGGYSRSVLWLAQGKDDAAHAALREFLAQMLAEEQFHHVTSGLAGCAEWAHRTGRHTQAATLWGAVSIQRQEQNTPLPSAARQEEQAAQEIDRAALGDAAWQAAWDRGQRMKAHQAVAYALLDA